MSHLRLGVLLSALLVAVAIPLSCTGAAPELKPRDAATEARAAVLTAQLACTGYQIGVGLGQVPADPRADEDCAPMFGPEAEPAPVDAGAAGSR